MQLAVGWITSGGVMPEACIAAPNCWATSAWVLCPAASWRSGRVHSLLVLRYSRRLKTVLSKLRPVFSAAMSVISLSRYACGIALALLVALLVALPGQCPVVRVPSMATPLQAVHMRMSLHRSPCPSIRTSCELPCLPSTVTRVMSLSRRRLDDCPVLAAATSPSACTLPTAGHRSRS